MRHAQRATTHPRKRSSLKLRKITLPRLPVITQCLGCFVAMSAGFIMQFESSGNAGSNANLVGQKIQPHQFSERPLQLGEPELSVLQWTDVSSGAPQALLKPLFDPRKLFALAQPIQFEAQQGALNIGGYLYNPDSYLSVEPRLSQFENRQHLFLLPESRLRAYFGLLHSHTFASDGIGHARDAFRMAREIAKLDFFAVTDHAEYWWKKSSSEWEEQRVLAREETRENFIALAGFEYSHPAQGHIVVLNSQQWTSAWQSPNLSSFFDWLSDKNQHNALGIFAHPGFHKYRNWFDLGHFRFDARVAGQMIGVETVHRNVWQRALRGYGGKKPYLDEAADAGWWVGSVASQDNHTPFWGLSDQSRVAVLLNSLSHSALIEALSRRHFYSTQSPQLQVALGLYDSAGLRGIMGDVLAREELKGSHALLRLRMFEPNPLLRPQKIEFVVNGRKERTLTFLDLPSQLDESGEFSGGTQVSWIEKLLNNGIVTARPYEWGLELRRAAEPEIFEVSVPLVLPECRPLQKIRRDNSWSIVVRYYQGDRAELLTTTSPLTVRCS